MESDFSNKSIAYLLKKVAAVYTLTNENRFKVIAYQKAADTIERLNREIKDIWQQGKLKEIPGFGPAIQAHLDEYFKKGKSKHFDNIFSKIPLSVFELMQVPTIGPKTAYKLITNLHLENSKNAIEEVIKAAENEIIAKMENFGVKSQKEILDAIIRYKRKPDIPQRMILPYAFSLTEEIIGYMKKHPMVERIDPLGSLRRMVATIGDIDIAIQIKSSNLHGASYKSIIDHFINFPKTEKIDNAGEKKASIIVRPQIRIDLRIQQKHNYGSMLQYFTGSKTHNIKLREYALKKGYSLSEYGVKPLNSQNSKLNIYQFKDEAELYNFLNLQYIPPELREGLNEIELAKKNRLPVLVEPSDIKADLHIHSSYDLKPSHDSGNQTFLEILENAKKLQYEYIGFTDHNPKISGSSDREITAILKKRYDYLTSLREKKNNKNLPQFFIGIESDIQSDGKLAVPQSGFAYLDFIIASIHSNFQMSKEAMTARILKALGQPKVKIFGHPTGRLIGKRNGYEADWPKIFDFCRSKDISIEINSWPERLDLSDIMIRDAQKHKVKFIINTDSHDISQMENMFFGVSVARRGWLEKNVIMNTLAYKEFKNWINKN